MARLETPLARATSDMPPARGLCFPQPPITTCKYAVKKRCGSSNRTQNTAQAARFASQRRSWQALRARSCLWQFPSRLYIGRGIVAERLDGDHNEDVHLRGAVSNPEISSGGSYFVRITGVAGETIWANSAASQFVKSMQPCDVE